MSNAENQYTRALAEIRAGQVDLQRLLQANNSTLATMIEQLIKLRTELNEYEIEAAAARAFRNENDIQRLEFDSKAYEIEIRKLQDAQRVAQETLEKLKTGTGGTTDKIKRITSEMIAAQTAANTPVDLKNLRLSEKAFRWALIAIVAMFLIWLLFDPASFSQGLLWLAERIGNK